MLVRVAVVLACGCAEWSNLYERSKAEAAEGPLGETGFPTSLFPPSIGGITDVVRDFGALEDWVASEEPSFGTHGDWVTVRGGPFPADTFVTFDDIPSLVTEWRSERELRVRVPDVQVGPFLGGVRQIDVEAISSEAGVATPSGLFTYFTPLSDVESVGAVGLVQRSQAVGGYWSDRPETLHRVQIQFPVDSRQDYLERLFTARADTCVSDDAPPQGIIIYRLEPEYLELRYEPSDFLFEPIRVERDWSQASYIATFDEQSFRTERAYRLHIPPGASGQWPSFDVQDFVGKLTSLQLEQPAIAGSELPQVSRSIAFRWLPPPGDVEESYVTLQLSRVRFGPGANVVEIEEVYCTAIDDGEFDTPPLWSSWLPFSDGQPEYDQIEIRVARVVRAEAIMPHNGGQSAVFGSELLHGLAETIP